MNLTLYNSTNLELRINNIYQINGIYHVTDLDIGHIAEIFNAELRFHSRKTKVYWDDDFCLVYLELDQSEDEIRKDFFHELGHIAMHVGNQNKLPKTFVQYQEEQASHFQLYASMPIYMIEKFIYEAHTIAIFEKVLVEAFCLPILLVRKRIGQIQNRIYQNQLDREWRKRKKPDTSYITAEYIKNLQAELGRKWDDRYGGG
ncbi:hypothetical protein OB236_38505 [Paenibacillus sp. WQ 127069]|uniref:IrrE N-terminal-like domain-containing protein n=1 Tax=Paenibacillus baimaensis TaxID=2982185 RepID=A0ABT2UTQ9_9BACL|nr:ImmA/IrrE family metallo-endopeptidase [Paenibacillus sp. WQ 127069]MCU6798034.1 hypothetical protein [Paenibacillus sp. WQ 127069]